jgi:D-lyxose ketol-isomerase
MLTREQLEETRQKVADMLTHAGIAFTDEEYNTIEVADFGLEDLQHQALQIITYVNTDRYCAKEIILFPRQTCPEHRHPPVEGEPGKQETFRVRWGNMWLYVAGEPSEKINGKIPPGCDDCYTIFHEIEMNPGDQYTLPPDALHWFQAGDEGVIVSEFSSCSRDEADIWTDPRIRRMPEYE